MSLIYALFLLKKLRITVPGHRKKITLNKTSVVLKQVKKWIMEIHQNRTCLAPWGALDVSTLVIKYPCTCIHLIYQHQYLRELSQKTVDYCKNSSRPRTRPHTPSAPTFSWWISGCCWIPLRSSTCHQPNLVRSEVCSNERRDQFTRSSQYRDRAWRYRARIEWRRSIPHIVLLLYAFTKENKGSARSCKSTRYVWCFAI
jgi:hypothetical protein